MDKTDAWIETAFKYKLMVGADRYEGKHLKGSISCIQIFGDSMDASQIRHNKDCHVAGEDNIATPCPEGSLVYLYNDMCYQVFLKLQNRLLIILHVVCDHHYLS